MKQKRKVKSLIPQKKFTSKSLKTAGLVILGSALYLASITLLTTSVAFGANEAGYETFTGFNLKDFPIKDKAEVVYAARFATRDNFKLNNNNKIIDIFMNKDGVLYIIPKPVIVNQALDDTRINHQRNEVEEKVYGHVLGGDENKVHSNNITIIAGYENKVNTGNDNAVILGGEKNTINQGEGTPSAIIGGTNNTIETGHKGSNVIIGGNNNKITENVSSSAILGGEKNTIESNNAIVGGSNVTISGTENVFAYSNSSNFTPKNPNSFFLNMQKGVGINMEASSSLNGLYVSGAVSLGFIDIKKPCNSNNNYGLEGQYDGCLVGCTTGGWRMLDLGEKCENVCNNAKNNLRVNIHCPTHEEDDDLVAPTDYKAFCDGPADKSNATQCGSLKNAMNNYKNVVFETKLIDSETQCPTNNPEDKCIFKCKQGYHLTGDINDPSKKKCYADCYLPWDTNHSQSPVPTNTIITGYNGDAFCSNDNGEHDDCSKHKKRLICYNHEWYIYNNKRTGTTLGSYNRESCTLSNYRCNPTYKLKKDNILSESYYNDVVGSHTWNTGDRSTTILTRGQYELCLDYDPQEPAKNSEQCNEVDKNTPHTEHYKFIKCNTGYDEMEINGVTKCMKQCEFTPAGETKPTKKKHNQTITLYSGDSATCPDICTSKTFTCNDGSWVNSGEMNTFKYKECSLKSQDRDPTFTIPETTYKTRENAGYTKHSEYESETISIVKKQNNECENETKYKIVGCKDPYFHLSPSGQYCIRENSSRGRCGSLIEYSHRTDNDEEPFQSVEFGKLERTAGSTWAKNVWSGTWDNREVKSRNKCGSGCDSGFSPRKTNGKTYCVKDGSCPTNPDRAWCPNGNKPNIKRSSTYGSTWTCPGEGVGAKPSSSCHFCAEGYEWDGTVCYHCEPGESWNPDYRICEEPVTEEGRCHNHDSNNISWSDYTFDLLEEAFNDENIRCFGGDPYGGSSIYDNVGKIIGYSWTCLGSNYDFEHSDECHECEPGYTWNNDTCIKSNGEGCVGTNCPDPDDPDPDDPNPNPNGDGDEDGECNNDIKYGCFGGDSNNNERNESTSERTWKCYGLGNGANSELCKKCKNGYTLSGNNCIKNETKAKCGTNSNRKYFTNEAHLRETNNLCDEGNPSTTINQENNEFSWTCSDSFGTARCTAYRLDCGSASGGNFANISELNANNKCSPTQPDLLDPTVYLNGNTFEWECKKDSASKTCKANKVAQSCRSTLIVDPDGGKVKVDKSTITSTGYREKDCNSTGTIENINLTKNVASTDICKIYLKNIPNETGINTTIITTTVYKYNGRNKTPPQNCSLNQGLFTYPGTDGKSCKIKVNRALSGTTVQTGSIQISEPAYADHEFLGWYTSADGGDKILGTGTRQYQPKSCNINLYAHWSKLDNGECDERKVRGCANDNRVISTGTYMTDGKITGVHWQCKGRDSTSDVCKINCEAGETLSRDDTTHNYECKSENINGECKYGGSEPQCKGSIEPSNVVGLDCGFTRKCKGKGTGKTDNCRMEYVAQKTTYNRQEILNTSVFTNNEVCVAGNAAATNPVSMDIIQSLSNFNRGTNSNCMNATSGYRRRTNNGEDWKKGDICKMASPYCIPCFACQFGGDYNVTSSTTPGKCTIGDTDYAENHSQCGLLKQNCTISNPTCISYNIEKNGIDVCKNDSITKQTGLSKDECIEVQENKPRRRTAPFGPTYGGTTYEIFNKGDLCSPGSSFCAPCAVCVCEGQGQEESICNVTVSNTHAGGTIYEPGYLSDFALVINGYMYSTTTDRPCTPSPGNSQICKFSVPELLEYKGKPVQIQATLTQGQNKQYVQANLGNVSQYGGCNFSVSL